MSRRWLLGLAVVFCVACGGAQQSESSTETEPTPGAGPEAEPVGSEPALAPPEDQQGECDEPCPAGSRCTLVEIPHEAVGEPHEFWRCVATEGAPPPAEPAPEPEPAAAP